MADQSEESETARRTPSNDRVNTPERPKSTASSEIVFESRKKRRKGTPTLPSEDSHEVTFTVTIAMAVPTAYDEPEDPSSPEHEEHAPDLRQILKKKVIEAPRAQNYYHLEYQLLPGQDELMKTDVVNYGMACKIYMEKHDARVVKTWQDGDVTWFAWAHSHTVHVTKEMLLQMFHHDVQLRVWDTKDKCSNRARFDRPKLFKLPQPKPGEKPEDIGGVKAMVTKQMKNFLGQQPKKGCPVRPLPSQVSVTNLCGGRKQSESAAESRRSRSGIISPSNSNKTLVAVPKKDAEGRGFSRLGQLAGTERLEERGPPQDKKGTPGSMGKSLGSPTLTRGSPAHSRGTAKSHAESFGLGEDKSRKGGSTTNTKEDRELRKQMVEQARNTAERIKKYGVAMIPLRLAQLFGDKKIITCRLDKPLAGIEDVFLGVTVNLPLLSPSQKEELNPMIIQIRNVTSMPQTPLSFGDLRLKCHPVYSKYHFFKEPEHITPGKEHDRDLYWDDTNVVLLGTMDKSELREYLNGPPMEIEVHDRDRRPEEVALKPTLFGDDLEDEKIANVGTVESRRTLHNPFKGRDKPWDPYGVAKVDLSELLLGHRYLELTVPIHNCPLPDMLGLTPPVGGKIVGIAGAVDGPVERPLSAGHYIQDTAMMKVKIELARPLTTPQKVAAKEPLPTSRECPFSRIIFMFGYHNLSMLHKVQSLVMDFNAKALGLDTMPQHVIDAALSTYKLSVVQQCSLDLDIVTGFHVLDGERHMFVLEGLRDKAIARLWEALPQPENSDVQVLFNSDLSFGKRLYGPLDVDLCRVKLHEPLSLIVQQSLLYVRDMVVRPCFDALTKLEQLTKMKKMMDVVRNELFPTADMVVSMSREFGVPFTQKDFEDLQPSVPAPPEESPMWVPQPYQAEPSRNWTPIDNFNTGYMEKLRHGKVERPNFVEANIREVQAQSEISHAERERTKKPTISVDVDTAHNYSGQYLNSMELAREKLRQYLCAKDPDARNGPRFAYNQEFNSALFCPVNLKEEAKLLAEEDHAMWRTEDGWIFPGMRSTKDSNVHANRPDPARLDELTEEWIENILHSNQFKSPLERGRFPWPQRQEDLDLYTQPEPNFGNQDPLSIHLAGIHKAQERIDANAKSQEEWKSRIVVDDIQQHFHRVLPETEMKQKGFYSSNQLDRLKAMMKDSPTKLGFQSVGCPDVNVIPPLSVVNNPLVDTHARRLGVKLQPATPPGARPIFKGYNPGQWAHTWTADDNHVPCKDYNHNEFHQLKGHDFNIYHKNRNKLSQRQIQPMKPEERENHLFRTPVFSASPYPRPLPSVGKRSMSAQPCLSPRGQQVGLTSQSLNTEPEANHCVMETSSGLQQNQAVRLAA